jgi:hypothetical protein
VHNVYQANRGILAGFHGHQRPDASIAPALALFLGEP